MDLEKFRKTKLYQLFGAPMKVSAVIYFLDKDNKGLTFSELEENLKDDIEPKDLSSAIQCLKNMDEIDYGVVDKERGVDVVYKLTSGPRLGFDELVEMMTWQPKK